MSQNRKITGILNLCIECHEREVQVKKRSLCLRCYSRIRKEVGIDLSIPTLPNQRREMDFIRNYFDHQDWVAQPATFRIGPHTYTPDFYDGKRRIFIEVAGTRQAYHAAKFKYVEFRTAYPNIPLEVREPDGSLVDEEGRICWAVKNNGKVK